jgi:hypothetical protein
MGRVLLLRLAAVIMILLGVVRGLGGALLVARGRGVDSSISSSAGAAMAVSVGLLIVGALEIVCGIGVLRRCRSWWRLGMLATALFIVGGLINGTVLYGHPGAGGTTANVAVAAVIVVLLVAGRGGLATSACSGRAPGPKLDSD